MEEKEVVLGGGQGLGLTLAAGTSDNHCVHTSDTSLLRLLDTKCAAAQLLALLQEQI